MKLPVGVTLLIFTAYVQASQGSNPNQWSPGRPVDMSKVQPLSRLVTNKKKVPGMSPLRRYPRPAQVEASARQMECGKENRPDRVIGGDEAVPNQFPWLVAILPEEDYLCTGSLIHPNWVLTVAHCINGYSSFVIQLGAHNVSAVEPNKIEITSTEAYEHENFDGYLANDIALIRLPQPAPLGYAVALSCLPSRSDVGNTFAGDFATITGWGVTSQNGDYSDTLHYARDRAIVENIDCEAYYGSTYVNDRVMCVDTVDDIAMCSGDAGSPLNLQRGEPGYPYLQVGLASFGSSSGCTYYPSGYTRLTEFLDWIETTTNGEIVIED